MEIKSSKFIASFPSVNKCPNYQMPEVTFIGRSNVGKSSLINMLCNKKNMAHTSNKPGKTQLINYYLINENWHLVDLPGYGYAKISKKARGMWKRMIDNYMLRRADLLNAFILIDASIGPQKIDLDYLNWMGEHRVPFSIVYTKTDKVSQTKLDSNIKEIQNALKKTWSTLPKQIITSASKRTGKEELLNYIEQINQSYFE